MRQALDELTNVDEGGQVSLGVAGDQLELDTSSPGPRSRCQWCGGCAVEGSTCPRSIKCPDCGAPAGAACRRPSSHEADVLHAARIRAAEELDAAAGIDYAPAPIAGQLELEGRQ